MPELTQFDPETATDDYFQKRIDFLNRKREEESPDDPPTTLEASINNAKGWKHIPSIQLESWHLWEDGKIIAEIFPTARADENNNHLCNMNLYVLPEYRGKGYAKLLLSKLLDFADKHKRRLVQTHTSSRIPSGQGFAEYLNAQAGYNASENQLDLSKLDIELIDSWLDIETVAGKDFEMGFWGDVYPDDEIQDIVELMDVMNTAPREDLDMNDSKTTPEKIREFEAYMKVRGDQRWGLYVRHKESGELAGYTITIWEPETPDVLYQEDTGVLPKYRGNSLGKWLKAAMLKRVIAEKPNLKFVRTGNAASNAPMLAINHAMGFELYVSEVVWELAVDKIREYLAIAT